VRLASLIIVPGQNKFGRAKGRLAHHTRAVKSTRLSQQDYAISIRPEDLIRYAPAVRRFRKLLRID
jgi:hypothetical protein